MTPLLDQRVRLSSATRLRFDAHSHTYILLSPERGLRLNATASNVVLRCNGRWTVREIVREMFDDIRAAVPEDQVTVEQVAHDVQELILTLRLRGLLTIEHVR